MVPQVSVSPARCCRSFVCTSSIFSPCASCGNYPIASHTADRAAFPDDVLCFAGFRGTHGVFQCSILKTARPMCAVCIFATCILRLRQVLCAACHPYSLHLFERLGTGLTMKSAFCSEFYGECSGPDQLNLAEGYCDFHAGGPDEEDQYWSYPLVIEREDWRSTEYGNGHCLGRTRFLVLCTSLLLFGVVLLGRLVSIKSHSLHSSWKMHSYGQLPKSTLTKGRGEGVFLRFVLAPQSCLI